MLLHRTNQHKQCKSACEFGGQAETIPLKLGGKSAEKSTDFARYLVSRIALTRLARALLVVYFLVDRFVEAHCRASQARFLGFVVSFSSPMHGHGDWGFVVSAHVCRVIACPVVSCHVVFALSLTRVVSGWFGLSHLRTSAVVNRC